MENRPHTLEAATLLDTPGIGYYVMPRAATPDLVHMQLWTAYGEEVDRFKEEMDKLLS